jgi:hypothetical protein
MAKYLFLILGNATEGRDDEFNAWYDNQHLGDVLKIPGFVSAQRFALVEGGPISARKYLTLYEVETEGLAATQAALGAAAGGPAMPMSSSLDTSTLIASYFKASGEKVLAS